MTRLLKESFIPILLVIGGIFLLVFYSHYVADIDADQVTIIEIPSLAVQTSDEQEIVLDEESFAQVEKLRSDDPIYREAYQLIKNKQWQQAEQLYLDLIQDHDTSQGRTDLGFIYYKQADYKNAVSQFTRAIKQEPVFLPAYYYRAKTLGKMKSYDESAGDYLVYIKHFTADFSAHMNLGLVRLKQQQYQQAVPAFTEASELAPGRKKSKALYLLGKSYQKSGIDYYHLAAKSYQSSIRVFPGNIKPRMGLASLAENTEQGRNEAVELYKQVLQLKPNHSAAYFALAAIYSAQGESRAVKEAYSKAIEYNPSHIPARFNLGLIYLREKKWREAADQFQAIINFDPEHARAYFNLGRSNYRLQYYDQALKNYQTALELRKGDYPEVIVNIGLIYSAKKDYEKAIEYYSSALQKNKSSAKLYYNIGLAYSKLKQHDQAIQAFQSAIKYQPKYAQAWYNIGLMHARKQNTAQSIQAYQKAIQIKSDYRSAQLNLAVSMTRIGELKKAEIIYRQVLESHPRYASAWINLGLVLIEQQLFSEAEEVLSEASKLEPDNERVMGLLAKALASQGKYTTAVEYYRTTLDINPASKKYRLEYVRTLKQMKAYETALAEAEKAMQLHPDSQLLIKEYDQINLKLKSNNL